MKYHTGEDQSSGDSFLSIPGNYHLVIQEASEPARKRDGTIIAKSAFGITAAVLAGSAEGQIDKVVNLTFFAPSLQSKDGGKMSRKKIDRFLIAVNLIQPGTVNQEVDVDIEECIGRQFCARLEHGQDPKYLEISFANVYHVDDPEAADIPKSHEGLNVIPSHFRRVGMQKLRGNGSGKATAEEVDRVSF